MNKRQKEFIKVLQDTGIRKEVVNAFKKYEQGDFFDPIFKGYYYSDEPIPIGYGEKFNSSLTLAKMINFLSPDKENRVLEIGTGSGYSTAILSYLYNDVVTIEYHEELALAAKDKLTSLNINNVKYFAGDVMHGDIIPGMFDNIIIFAACLSRPHFLMPYLQEKGSIVYPMGPAYQQQIVVMKDNPGKNDSEFKIEYRDICFFSPLKGMY